VSAARALKAVAFVGLANHLGWIGPLPVRSPLGVT
jgi:hypothetical protein